MSGPQLLAGTSRGAMSLERHLEVHGSTRGRDDLIDAVERVGLRGRGGASFPTAVKLRGAAKHRGPRTVLVNAAEGEPLSRKDRVLLERTPHLVLDGALAAARVIDAREVVVAIREDAVNAITAVNHAVDERGRKSTRIRVRTVPVAYLAGQESALINYLDRRPLRPSVVPPLPVERGLGRRPTLVQNAETLAHLALIDRGQTPSTALVTLASSHKQPAVFEVSEGITIDGLLSAAGIPMDSLQGVLVGGLHGTWHRAPDAADVVLDDRTRAAGVVFALDQHACAPMEIVRAIRWLADQSAGQCGPCANGMPAMASLLEQSVFQRAPSGVLAQVERWSGDLTGRGACHLPDGSMRFLRSGLSVFAKEFAMHFRQGRCQRCVAPPALVPADTRMRRAA